MKAPSASEAPSGRLKISSRTTKKMTAAVTPRMIELRQVGGRSTRATGLRLERARALASARLRGLERVLVSMRPPWVPRRLRRRFFLVCAMALNLIGHGGQPPLDDVALRVEAAHRHVHRIAHQSSRGSKA